MGFLSRLRGPSSHPSNPNLNTSSSSSSHRPTTPLPYEPSYAGSSVAGDRDRDVDATPRAKEKKPFSLWKGKSKADPSVGGRRYEDLSLRGQAPQTHGSGRPRQSGAWDRDTNSIYSERPASPLDPPSRVWGPPPAGGERQRSASASGIHPTGSAQQYAANGSHPVRAPMPGYQQQQRYASQPQGQPPPRSPTSPIHQRYSSDLSRIPPPSPASTRTAPGAMFSSTTGNGPRSPTSPARMQGQDMRAGQAPPPPPKFTNGIDIPIAIAPAPAQGGGFLGKLTFEDKAANRGGPWREREPSWLVGSMDDGSGLFGLSTAANTASNSSIATSGMDGHAPAPSQGLVPDAFQGATPSPIDASNAATIQMPSSSSTPRPITGSPIHPTIPYAKPAPAMMADNIATPTMPSAPSAWRPEIVQAAATALPPSMPPSSVSSPVVDQEEDKKGKFWKGRGRRSSKAMSDAEHEAASPAETPGIVTGPRQPESGANGRPPQLRRPSSSFFARPFNRVSSRTSVIDLESTPVDDGSFQLKGFRHVSGVSALQGDDGDKDRPEIIMDPSSSLADQDGEADKWQPAPPVRPTLSRPASASSNRTLDEVSSAKVSVAAFKRGIRRPSETVDKAAVGDADADDDSEDDVPLGMLNRSALARPASSASLARLPASSAVSPVSTASVLPRPFTIHANDLNIRSEVASPSSTTQVDLPTNMHLSPQRGGTESPKERDNSSQRSAFVVKSAKSTRSLHSLDSRDRDARSMRSVTPDNRSGSIPPLSKDQSRAPTRPTSPLSAAQQAMEDREEYMISPVKQKAYTTHRTEAQAVKAEAETAAELARTRTASPAPGPPIMPLGIPLPQESPSLAEMDGLVLPPRPDEMEDEPTSPRSISSTVTSPRARVTSVVEPLKRLSGFLSSQSLSKSAHGDDESFDTSLALHSMMFAEQDGRAIEPSSPPSSTSAGRLSLQDRLNAIKPSVPRIQTDLSPAVVAAAPEADPEESLESLAAIIPDEVDTPIARTHLSTLAGRLTPIASQDGSLAEDMSSDASSVRARPFGPRDQPLSFPTTNGFAPEAPAYRGALIPADDTGSDDESSDESSDEETLAQLKTRASRSTLNLSRPPPMHDDVSFDASSPRSARTRLVSPSLNDLSLGPVTSRLSSASSPSVPKMSISPSDTNFHRPGMLQTQSSRSSLTAPGGSAGLPISPSGKSVAFVDPKEHQAYPTSTTNGAMQVQGGAGPAGSGSRGRMAYSMHDQRTSASPASSQSGLTGDSAPGPMTPGESSVASMPRNTQKAGLSSSQSSFSLGEERSRRLSQTSVNGAMSIAPGPSADSTTLAMMKQQWQAQFMAAAYAASEEQWERASSVGGTNDSASQAGYFGQQGQAMPMNMPFGYQMPGMPAQNQQQMMGMGMPFGMQFPGMPMGMQMPGMSGMPNMGMQMGMQFPFGFSGMMGQGVPGTQGMPGMPGMPGMSMPSSPAMGGGMYNYGPGAQSVFGGEFGPPTSHRGYSAPDVRSVSASVSGNGLNGSGYVSSPLAQPPQGASGNGGSSARQSGSRHSRSTSNLRGQSAASVYGTATSGGVGASRNTRPRHHSNARSVSALPTIQQSPQKDPHGTPRQPSYSGLQDGTTFRPGPRGGAGTGDGMRHSSYDLLSAPAPPSSWRNGGSEVGRARPRTHFAS